ncbi:MAG TPA: hypothetical protein VJ697_13745 [Nitrososphaeraceae archaeon]|nr:hypothetical protein [Nitrososphaeraceae archaeon]
MAKGKSYSTQSLIMALLLEQHKKLVTMTETTSSLITNRDLLWMSREQQSDL